MCVCSVAAVLLLWHVDTALPPVSASRLHFCRLGRLPDSCFGIALRLLFNCEASEVSSYTSPHSTPSPPPPLLSLHLSPSLSGSTCACLSSLLLKAGNFEAVPQCLRILTSCLGGAEVVNDHHLQLESNGFCVYDMSAVCSSRHSSAAQPHPV